MEKYMDSNVSVELLKISGEKIKILFTHALMELSPS
jgi:hypothetical protein